MRNLLVLAYYAAIAIVVAHLIRTEFIDSRPGGNAIGGNTHDARPTATSPA